MQLTLEAASPGGRVRKRAYDVATTPPDESAADRAKRKSANRNSALRARKALAQITKARTRVVRVAEYVKYSGPKALLTLTRVAILMCDPTTHTHPSSKQVELVTTHEYSEYSFSGGNRLFSRRRLRLSAGSCALHGPFFRVGTFAPRTCRQR